METFKTTLLQLWQVRRAKDVYRHALFSVRLLMTFSVQIVLFQSFNSKLFVFPLL